jgi:hypothetical protein
VLKNYADLMVSAENAKVFIQDRDGNSREDYYEKCVNHVNTLKSINQTFKAARNDLNVKREDKKTQTFRYFFTISISLIIALLTATVAFLIKRP